jgi:hypothetical protein
LTIHIKPKTLATGPDNPKKQIGVNVWNDGHELTATADRLIGTNGSGIGTEVNKLDLPVSTAQQAAIDLKVSTASLAASGGAALVGRSGGGTVADGIFLAGRAVPIAGSKMQIDRLIDSAAFPLEDEAGIWAGPVVTRVGLNGTFGPGQGGANAPTASLFVMANNDGSSGDVCALIADSVARSNSSVVFGANIIARSTGLTGVKLVGAEIDVEPSAGDSGLAAGSGGLFINMFSKALPGPAMQTGGVGGGTFNNGIVLGGLAPNAAGVAISSTGSADSLINSTAGTFTTAAVLLGSGATKGVKWAGDGGSIYFDGTNRREVLPAGGSLIWRNPTDTASLASIDSGGNFRLEGGGTVYFESSQSSISATAGANALPSNPVGFITVSIGGTIRKIPYYAS